MLRSPTMVSSVARVYEQCATGAMMAHCCSATAGEAAWRTWLYAARLGPTDTSYHDMNQRPGTSIAMFSCHRPPLYQAGSFGVRRIIAPPVSTGIASAEVPGGRATAVRIFLYGTRQSDLLQATGRHRWAT